MIIKILCVIAFVLLTAALVTMWEDIKKVNKKKLSFKEALDLTDLPVVTFIVNGKKLNFVLDSGATHSVINETLVDELGLTIENFEDFGIDINTASGNILLNKYVKVSLQYDNKRIFNETLLVINMTEQFNSIKESTGVNVHGLLGSDFFSKNKFIIDYDILAAYVK